MAAPIIPDKPTYWFAGVEQPPSFADGVKAFKALLLNIEAEQGPDDQEIAERFARDIAYATDGEAAHRLGFAAALAEWLAIGRHSEQSLCSWHPLPTLPEYRDFGGGTVEDPGPRSRYFDVDGAAVTVSPDLACYVFDVAEANHFPLGDVRNKGREITRDEFDDLRARTHTTAESGRVSP